ncbi:MAG: hypothetical protein C0501_14105 [Isosphaera sp.]|nr:hypothetical protein [Isosphaera sp.]
MYGLYGRQARPPRGGRAAAAQRRADRGAIPRGQAGGGEVAVSPADAVLAAVRGRTPAAWLVAVAGVPGAGKSTVAAAVAARAAGAVVVPMDGYHLPRAVLTADQMIRRGAPDTFDPAALRANLVRLRATGSGTFPGFDHAAGDPVPGAVVVTPGTPLVVVEGLYLLLRDWRLADLFDFTVFLDCPPEVAVRRVADRHFACGLAATAAEARRRAETNDRRNADAILADGCRERADLVVPAGDGP